MSGHEPDPETVGASRDQPVEESPTLADPGTPARSGLENPDATAGIGDDATLADAAGDGLGSSGSAETVAVGSAENREARAATDAGTAPRREADAPLPRIEGYALEGVLGRGGMGVVYRARETRLGRPCALKVIRAGAIAQAEDIERFLVEARTIARLRHPNVVQIYRVGEWAGGPYVELELAEGGTLAEKLAGSPQPPRAAAEMVESLARATAESHRLGIVHRDLKPSNVLLTPEGQPKITDYGLAKLLDEDLGLTRTESLLGTPSYMAPEQADRARGAVGPATDVYALGAILYEMLTGRPPFRAAGVLETLEQVRTADPVAPSRLVPGLSRDLETIALTCLRKEPGRRYASAEALADDLARYRRGEPVRARRIGPIERGWRWARRNPAAAALAASLVLLGGVLTFGALAYGESQRREAEQKDLQARERGQLAQERAEAQQATARRLRTAYVEQAESALRAREPGYRARVERYVREALALDDAGGAGRTPDPRLLLRDALGDPIGLEPRDRPSGPLADAGWVSDEVTVADLPDGQGRFEAVRGSIVFHGPRGDVAARQSPPLFNPRVVAASPDGRWGVVGYDDGFAVWELPAMTLRTFVRTPTVGALAIHPSGRWLAVSCYYNPGVELWSLESNRLEAVFRSRTAPRRVRFTADGAELVALDGSGDRPIAAWPILSTVEKRSLAGHGTGVTDLAFRPDGSMLASVEKAGVLKLWDLADGGRQRARFQPPHILQCVRFTPDGSIVAVGGMGNLILLEPDTAREIGRLDVSREVGEIWGLEFEPAGRYLAVGGSNGVLAVAVERSGERVELGGGLRLALPGIYALGVHPTGRAIVALDRRSRLHRWDLVTAAPSRQISEAVGLTVYNAAFSPEGDHLRFIGFGDRLIDYDWQAERLSTLVEGLDAPFTPIPSPDGRWLALMQGRQMTLLSGATGAEAFRLPPEASGAWSYRWSPDGRQLALGFPDGSIRIWNLEAVRAALAPLGLDVPETALDAPAPRPEPAALAFLEKRQRTAGLEEAVASHAAAVRRGDEAGREAIERRVVQELGSDEAAWRDLARALAATAGSDESRAELANAAARTGPRFWLSLAMAVEGAGWGMTARTLGDRAEREYAAAVERRPEDLGTRHNHALALKRLGRDAQAIEELRAALNGDAPPITSRVLLARWLRQAGDLDEAAAELRKAAGSPALDTGGEEVRTLAEEAASLAEALEGRRGNDAGRDFFETAISAYERHVAGRARDVSCRARLAVLLREEADRRGEEERARQADRALACLMGGEPVDRDRAVIAISSTADERTAGGSPDRALRLYDWLIRELEPAARTRGLDAYNLACLIVRRARLLHGERREVEWSGAIEWLRRAVALGYRDLTLMGTDPDLAELRGRPDFAGLTMDLTFPADPFARPVTGVR